MTRMTSKQQTPDRQFKSRELRIPPQNIETEKALLGALMLRPEGMYDVGDMLTRDSFYVDKHRMLFDAMIELHTRHEPIDLLSVSTRLKERGKFDSLGGGSYLAELVDAVPSSTNAKHYAEIIQRKYILRALIEAAAHISELGYNEAEAIESVLDEAEKKIYSITNSSVTKKFVSLKDTLDEAWERLDKMHKDGGELRGVPSGFPALDTLLSGFQKSDLIILAARPSMGKTTLALDIARQAAIHHNVPVGIFSLEMNTQQLVDRMLSAEARVNAWKLHTAQLSRALESRGGKPKLSDLRDSGSIEQDADIVMFIHREDKMDKNAEKTNIAEIIVEKHRNGPVGSIQLYFDEEKSTFMSIDKQHDYGASSRNAGGNFEDF